MEAGPSWPRRRSSWRGGNAGPRPHAPHRGRVAMNQLLAVLRLKRVWIPLALLVVYGLFGFLVLPEILRGQIVSGIRQNLKRDARLAKVRVNPFMLSLTLEGFQLADSDATPFVQIDRLFVDYQLSSLPRWAITLR